MDLNQEILDYVNKSRGKNNQISIKDVRDILNAYYRCRYVPIEDQNNANESTSSSS